MNVSKLARGFGCIGLKLKRPPKTCIPSKANITMKRKSSSSRDMIERRELSNEETRFLSELQYFVTLKMRRRRAERNTDTPSGFINSK